MPRMSLYAAAVINFYETLRFEVKDDVGITVATHGWIGKEMSSGRIMVEEGADMQWKEEREAAKAAVINFYETLRFEVKDDVGITVATHGWIGKEMSSGRIMVEEGADMQWKEEREVVAEEADGGVLSVKVHGLWHTQS